MFTACLLGTQVRDLVVANLGHLCPIVNLKDKALDEENDGLGFTGNRLREH